LAPATVDRPRHGASNAAPETDGHEWFTMDLADVLDALGTATGGLDDAEAALRLQQYGPNTLPRREPPGLFEIVLRQFKSPLIYLLGIAAGVSLVIGEIKDAAFIICSSCCASAQLCAAVSRYSMSMRRRWYPATSSTSSPATGCRRIFD
jgi:magnesium-transporting ATPase (P-type)